MKICIYGAGAIGGFLGAKLAAQGQEVTLIARGPHLAAMREKGLTLIMEGEETVTPVQATDDPREAGPQDYVIVTLKAHQAYEVAEQMVPLLGEDTAVVTAMNGVPWWYFYGLDGAFPNRSLESVDPGAKQWNLIGPERVIGCVVDPATEIAAPGVIKHTYGNKFRLGEPDGSISERATKLADAMEAAGFRAPVRNNIRDEIWVKLWGNLCFNPISVLTGATLDVIATDAGTRQLARQMMSEAEEIGRWLGTNFRVNINRRVDGAAGVGAHKTSMLQDLESRRALEIDALLTAVQEMGRMVKIPTPYIDAVLALVQQRGRTEGLYPTFPEDVSSPEAASA